MATITKILIGILTPGALIVLLLILSEFDIFFSSSAKEGRAMAVLGGGGQFLRWLLNMKNTHIEEDGEITRGSTKNGNYGFTLFGRPWIGIPFITSIYREKMQWETFDEELNKATFRNEVTPYLFINQTAYSISITKAEDKNNFPLDLIMDAIAWPVNAYTAKFGIENWQRNFRALLTKAANNVIGNYTFDQLKSEIDLETGNFAQAIMDELAKLPNGKKTFAELTGHEVIQIAIRKIDPDESRTDYRDALAAQGIAELKAKGVVAEAEGTATATKIVAEAKAKAIELEQGAETNIMEKQYAIKAKDDKSVAVAFASGIENHQGTLVLGKDVLPVVNTEKGGGNA